MIRRGRLFGEIMRKGRRKLRFHLPVVVQPGRIDRDRVVTTPAEAAEILLRQWPDGEFSKRLKAMQACLSVIRGEKPPHTARTAFIAAAKEARIFIAAEMPEPGRLRSR